MKNAFLTAENNLLQRYSEAMVNIRNNVINAELQKVENPLVYELLIADDLYDESIATNLDLYGGFYARLYNKTNCF
mgnify:CR=1 FL=1